MAKEIKDIQQIINDRADRKLEKAIRDIYTFLSSGENYELIKGVSINAGTSEKPNNIKIYSLFSSDGLQDKIIELNQQRYRSKETAAFVEKVESIRNDVDQLMENSGQGY